MLSPGQVFLSLPYVFAPRIDGDYLPEEPVTLLKEGRYHHVPILTGVNREEGCSMTAGEPIKTPLSKQLNLQIFNTAQHTVSTIPVNYTQKVDTGGKSNCSTTKT